MAWQPIVPSAALYAHFEDVRREFNSSVHGTLRSSGDYSQTTEPAMEPCCDVHHPECMCKGQKGGAGAAVYGAVRGTAGTRPMLTVSVREGASTWSLGWTVVSVPLRMSNT